MLQQDNLVTDIIDIGDAPKPKRPRGFQKGVSGNPAGKPKGTISVPDRLRQMIREHLPAIIEVLAQSALAGDAQAARLLLERALPPAKSTYAPVALPDAGDSLVSRGDTIIQAIVNGTVPPDVGTVLLQALATQTKLIEATELAQRIEALEATLKERQA
jgi:hypothetical protein